MTKLQAGASALSLPGNPDAEVETGMSPHKSVGGEYGWLVWLVSNTDVKLIVSVFCVKWSSLKGGYSQSHDAVPSSTVQKFDERTYANGTNGTKLMKHSYQLI